MLRRTARASRLVALAAATLAPLAPLALQAQSDVVAFVDVSVIPMDRERVLARHTVIVSGGRISAMGPSERVRPPRGATVIDGRGKYLIPGLGDAHAHLSTVGGDSTLAERALTLLALHGVTMARSMYTEPHHRRAQERLERDGVPTPRVLFASPAVTGQNAATPDAARALVRAHREAGYTLLKVLPGLSRETFDALVAEARALGMPVAGHVPASVGLEGALAAGMSSVEHLDGFLEALVPPERRSAGTQGGFFGLAVLDLIDTTRIAAVAAAVKAAGTVVVPTEYEMELFVTPDSGEALAGREEMRHVPPALLAQWTRQKSGFVRGAGVTTERSARYHDARRRLLRALHAAGVPIAAGSDAFNLFAVPGTATFHELETLVRAGLTPFDALAASTIVVARLVGLERETGVIAAGRAADLVLLDANPLADIASVRRQAGVMLRGRWLPRDEIARRLAALAFAPSRGER